MSVVYGKMITCERCGKNEFFKGGDEPENAGWTYRDEIGYLCPKCEEAYQEMISYFMDGVGNEI